jgi:hypothetical protein
MYATEIEEMHSKPGRFRVVYWSRAEDTTPVKSAKQLWKDDLSEQEARRVEIECYRTLNEL